MVEPAATVRPRRRTLGLTLSEFKIEGDLEAAPGDVSLLVTNNGSQQHNLVVARDRCRDADAERGRERHVERSGSLDVGTYELYCSVAGHAESGMVAALVDHQHARPDR